MSEPVIVIRRDRERMFEKRHPWVFSGAIHALNDDPADGDIVALRSENGTFLARGYWNHHSQINVHVLSWDEDEPIDDEFWRSRLKRAIDARVVRHVAKNFPHGNRLVNAENDALPGLIVDRYGDWLVLQALTMGIEKRKMQLAQMLMERLNPKGIYERSDVDVRSKEGLRPSVGLLIGEKPPELIDIEENGQHFLVDVYNGHKTGFYLDQRENRARLADILKSDDNPDEMTVLNCFSYTGGFTVNALAAGAGSVTSIEASADAQRLAQQNVKLNSLNASPDDFVVGDVFEVLRQYRSAGRRFDIIVLDPPKFAQNQRQVESATRGYKDINLLAFQLIKPGGMLMTFSCSGLIDADLFQKVVFGALVDAKREAQIVARLTAAADHPVALTGRGHRSRGQAALSRHV